MDVLEGPAIQASIPCMVAGASAPQPMTVARQPLKAGVSQTPKVEVSQLHIAFVIWVFMNGIPVGRQAYIPHLLAARKGF